MLNGVSPIKPKSIPLPFSAKEKGPALFGWKNHPKHVYYSTILIFCKGFLSFSSVSKIFTRIFCILCTFSFPICVWPAHLPFPVMFFLFLYHFRRKFSSISAFSHLQLHFRLIQMPAKSARPGRGRRFGYGVLRIQAFSSARVRVVRSQTSLGPKYWIAPG